MAGAGERGAPAIAIRTHKASGRKAAIQVRAEVLQDGLASAPFPGASGFVPIAEGSGALSDSGCKVQWRQSDIKRAIGAAEKAGLEVYRIEIVPDGTITIVVGRSAVEEEAAPAALSDLLKP